MDKLKHPALGGSCVMLCAGCLCALAAAGESSLRDILLTSAALAAFAGLHLLARRYCRCMEWLGAALFCGAGLYAAAQILSLGEFSWSSGAAGPLHELGAAWIALVFCVLYAPFGARAAAVATGAIAYVFGCANYFMMLFNGRAFLFTDFLSIKTALNVKGSYELVFEPYFFLGTLYALGFTALAFLLFGAAAGKPRRAELALGRLLPLAGAAVFAYSCFYGGLMYRNGIYINWNDNQFRESSVMNLIATASTLDIDAPDGYGPAALDEITLRLMGEDGDGLYYGYQPAGEGEKPNIVVVMSESFSDMREVADFKTDKPFLSFFDSLEEESVHGHVYSSVRGGNTANSEYEFLTGDSCAFLPDGAVAYQTYINYELGSLVSTLEAQGYVSAAFHPHWASGWNRVQVYRYFGFDRTLWREDFGGISTLRGYASDRWDYRELIKLYESERERAGDGNVFLFNITMQNHGGYTTESFRSDVSIRGHRGEFPRAEQYLSLIRITDEDSRELIDYFRGVEEPVLLLFFGDHQPVLETEFYDVLYGHDSSDLSLEEFQREYITPFYIWANYDIEPRDEGYTSINYLAELLLETAGLRGTPYGAFLREVRQSWPVLNANGALDSDGVWHYLSDPEVVDDELLKAYDILQYNRLFDRSGYRAELYELPAA